MAQFTHLHLHTEYSLLDGVTKIKPLLNRVAALGMKSCAMTDHGVMYGTYEFWSNCRALGIKPIIGCEVYVANGSRHDKATGVDNERYHLTLLARTQEGYHNLLKLVSLAHTEGFYYKPRVDTELLSQLGKGIIVLSGCLGSNFNRYLAAGKREQAVDWIKFLQSSFDQVYIEVQRNGIKESEDLLPIQVEIARELGLPIVATCDVHYLEQADYKVQEIAWCISDGTRLDDAGRRQYGSHEFYLKSPEEMEQLFADLPEAVTNTQVIADSVEEYTIEFERIQPKYDPQISVEDTRTRIRHLAIEGAQKRYGVITPEIQQRLDYELEVINNKGYNDYFLVVQDYINWARSQDILVGPGRGSGAGSVIAYCLGITNLDPFRWNLIFERFLNPERPSPPDFDIDFQDDRRDELFEYVSTRYGRDHTSFVGTFGRLKAKAAIRDVARVMGVDLGVADKLSKMVISKFGKTYTIAHMRADVPEFDAMIKADATLEELAAYVGKLEDLARHVSTHACGFLITPQPITDYLPVQLDAKNGHKVVTQVEGHLLEPMGLMKFDFLGLSNLTIIKNTVKQIKLTHGIEVDIDALPLDDADTFKLFQEGNTTAVFQFESDGMQKYLRELKPTEIEDLIFMNAAYRPGAMSYIHDYIERKNGRQRVVFPDESLSEVLKSTYGFAIYQEQVMNIAVVFAGYSLGEADVLRRAMGKKKKEVMAKEKEKFISKATANGHTAERASEVFAYLEPFADYGFNRSHSAAYAMIAYQTGYLKAKYPLEFLAGLMETDIGALDKLARDLEEARHMGIQILPPDINESHFSFSISGENIRFGLGGIKGVSTKVMNSIVDERTSKGNFGSLDDLILRVGPQNLSKKDLEFLIKVGALDKFGNRNSMLAIMPAIFEDLTKQGAILARGQVDLFSMDAPGPQAARRVTATPLPFLPPTSDMQKIMWEKELLGVFLTANPLDNFRWAELDKSFVPMYSIAERKDGEKVKTIAIVDSIKTIRTKTTGKPMSFLNLIDGAIGCEGVMFSAAHTKYIAGITPAKAAIVEGTVSFRNDKCSILIDKITDAESAKSPTKLKINICGVTDKDILQRIRACFTDQGQIAIEIIYGEKSAPKKIERKAEISASNIAILKSYL